MSGKEKVSTELPVDLKVFKERILDIPEPTISNNKVTVEVGADSGPIEFNDIGQLEVYLETLAGALNEKESSSQFGRDGRFMTISNIKDKFTKLLHEEGYAPATIFGVADRYLSEPITIVSRLSAEIHDIKESLVELRKINDADNPFANAGKNNDENNDQQATQDEMHALEQAIKDREMKRTKQTGAFVAALKNIIENPAEYGLQKSDGYKSAETKQSAASLKEKLSNDRLDEVFLVEGKRMPIKDKKVSCRELIYNFVDTGNTNKNLDESAKQLICDEVVMPLIHDEYDILSNKDLDQANRSEQLRAHDVALAEVLNTLVNDDQGVKIYGNLIYSGTLPDDVEVTLDDLPSVPPKLYLRDPYKLREQTKNLRGADKALARLSYWYEERYSQLSEDEVAEFVEDFKNVEKEHHKEMFKDALGYMPHPKRLAMIRVMFEQLYGKEGELGYDEEEFADFHATVTDDLFKQEGELITERERLEKSDEGYENKVRGIERRIEKLHEELVIELKSWLDPEKAIMKRGMTLGAADGILRLTYAN